VKAVKNHIALDADSIAKECGSTKASNIVMLGAASPFIDIPAAGIEEGIRQLFNRKGEDIVNLNLKAFRAGREYSEKNR
jgi:indolepyruvate ferredoxin oxidoreductase beta subunit